MLEVCEDVDEFPLDPNRFMPSSAFWLEHAPAASAAPTKAVRDKAVSASLASSSTVNDQDDFEDADEGPASVKRGKAVPLVAALKQPSAKTLAAKEAERRRERSFQYPIRIADVMFSLERDQGVAMSSADPAVPIERYWCGHLFMLPLCMNFHESISRGINTPLKPFMPEDTLFIQDSSKRLLRQR